MYTLNDLLASVKVTTPVISPQEAEANTLRYGEDGWYDSYPFVRSISQEALGELQLQAHVAPLNRSIGEECGIVFGYGKRYAGHGACNAKDKNLLFWIPSKSHCWFLQEIEKELQKVVMTSRVTLRILVSSDAPPQAAVAVGIRISTQTQRSAEIVLRTLVTLFRAQEAKKDTRMLRAALFHGLSAIDINLEQRLEEIEGLLFSHEVERILDILGLSLEESLLIGEMWKFYLENGSGALEIPPVIIQRFYANLDRGKISIPWGYLGSEIKIHSRFSEIESTAKDLACDVDQTSLEVLVDKAMFASEKLRADKSAWREFGDRTVVLEMGMDSEFP